MTAEERRMDKVVRSVSEVGYVGMVKRKLGWKLKDPEAWKKEDGSPEDKSRLDRMLEELRAENEKRRRSYSEGG
jgi:DNA modification methylase